MKNIILKLTLLSLIAGTAFLPQQANAMNINSTQEQYKLNKQLFNAVNQNNLEDVKKWLDAGANIEVKDDDDRTPLICASRYGYLNTVKCLIEHNANIEAKDNDDWTSLICASVNGYLDTVKHLIEHGANPYAKDDNNLTAYNYASQNGDTEIADYLLDVQNEFESFKQNPTTWTVAKSSTPDVSQSSFIKILCNNNIFYIDTVKYTDLCSIFAKFHNANKNEDLKKFLDDCGFSKEELKKLRKIGFPLNGQELMMQENLIKNTKESTSFDIKLFYNKNVIQNNQNN